MRVIRGAWSDETAHARGKQSGRSLVEAKADCVTERDTVSHLVLMVIYMYVTG